MDLTQLLNTLAQWIQHPAQLFPDGRAVVYVLLGGAALVAGLILAGLAAFVFLSLLRVFVPRQPKDEIVHNGIVIFDIDWSAERDSRRVRRERIPSQIRA